jgi:hypothetical protein
LTLIDKAKKCDMLLALCDASNLAMEPKPILEREGEAAFALAEALNDSSRSSWAFEAVIRAYTLIQV